MTDLATLDEFRTVARDGGTMPHGVFRLATGPAVEVEGVDRTLRFCFSDGSVDRAGDTIDPKGWELDPFSKNPVALWAHQSYMPPIGKASNVGVVSKRLMGDIQFATADDYEFADTIYRLTKGGYINACSVGFNPLEWSFVNDKDRPYGIDFKRQELLEISPCPVPCNGNALAQARAKGIDTRSIVEWAEKVLDDGKVVLLPRAEVETLRKQASERVPVKFHILSDVQMREAIAAMPTEEKAAIVKAGRKISKENMECLGKAMDHIKAVMDSNDPDADGDDNDAGDDEPVLESDSHVVGEASATAETVKERARELAHKYGSAAAHH